MEIALAVLAISNLILAIVSVLTLFKVSEVHTATNGMSEKLQEMAEQRGFEAGHKEAEEEAAIRLES